MSLVLVLRPVVVDPAGVVADNAVFQTVNKGCAVLHEVDKLPLPAGRCLLHSCNCHRCQRHALLDEARVAVGRKSSPVSGCGRSADRNVPTPD